MATNWFAWKLYISSWHARLEIVLVTVALTWIAFGKFCPKLQYAQLMDTRSPSAVLAYIPPPLEDFSSLSGAESER
jgi:hypothetical protein